MDDAAAMEGGERGEDRQLDGQRVSRRQRPAGQPIGERLAVEQFHAQKRLPVVLADVEQLADVRMTDRRRRTGLTREPLPHRRIRGSQDGLDRHRARQPIVPALVDDTHAAAPDLADDGVGADGVWHSGNSIVSRARGSRVRGFAAGPA